MECKKVRIIRTIGAYNLEWFIVQKKVKICPFIYVWKDVYMTTDEKEATKVFNELTGIFEL